MGKPDLAEIMRRLDELEHKAKCMEKVILRLPNWAVKDYPKAITTPPPGRPRCFMCGLDDQGEMYPVKKRVSDESDVYEDRFICRRCLLD